MLWTGYIKAFLVKYMDSVSYNVVNLILLYSIFSLYVESDEAIRGIVLR